MVTVLILKCSFYLTKFKIKTKTSNWKPLYVYLNVYTLRTEEMQRVTILYKQRGYSIFFIDSFCKWIQ